MYGSVVIWRFKPGTTEKVREANVQELIPAAQSQPGFKHYFVIRSGDNEYATLILYDSKENAEASFRVMLPLTQQKLGAAIEAVERHAGEVEAIAA